MNFRRNKNEQKQPNTLTFLGAVPTFMALIQLSNHFVLLSHSLLALFICCKFFPFNLKNKVIKFNLLIKKNYYNKYGHCFSFLLEIYYRNIFVCVVQHASVFSFNADNESKLKVSRYIYLRSFVLFVFVVQVFLLKLNFF